MRFTRVSRAAAGAGGAAAIKSRRKLVRGLGTTAAVAVASVAIAACGSSAKTVKNTKNTSLGTDLYGALPAAGSPSTGGTISVGQISGQTPTYIFPVTPGAFTSTPNEELLTQLFLPLYAGPNGAKPEEDPAMSIANAPVASNGNKTFTITLKKGFKWTDGHPVNANDVVFGYDELAAAVKESPANWGQYTPGLIPDNVASVKASGADTVVFNMTKSINPGFFLYNQLQDTDYGLFAMPSTSWNIASAGGAHLNYKDPADAKKIYDYLNAQSQKLSTWASNPLWKDVDGPYTLKSFNTTNSSYVLAPNPNYGGSQKATATLDTETFTSVTAQFNALKSGTLDVAGLDPTQLAQVPSLKTQGYSVFGGPAFGWDAAIINFKDTTDDFDKVIAQTYVRGAIQSLIDEPAIVTAVHKGAAVPAYGPTPPAPLSPYQSTSSTKPTYPYGVANAKKILTSHGWDVKAGGTTTCSKAGTGAGECGAGIPVGTPIKFSWADEPASASSIGVNESAIVASAAKQVGIDIELTTKTFNFLTSNYDDQNPAATKYTNDWGVNNFAGIEINYYPTQSGIWTPGGGFNFGDFDNAAVNKAVQNSIYSANASAVETENNIEAKELPVFFFPVEDYVWAVSKRIGGPAKSFTVLTQDVVNDPQYWYIKKSSSSS